MSRWITIIGTLGAYMLFHTFLSWKMENTGHTYYTQRVEQNKCRPKVYDIAHRYLPNFHKHVWISHCYVLSALVPLLFHEFAFQEFIEYAIVLFFIRDITTFVTILPKYKHDEGPNQSNTFRSALASSTFSGVYGKIFSGHFTIVLLATLIYYKYKIVNDVNILFILNIINALLILITRHHYTIDLIVAMFVTSCVWTNKIKLTLL